jgi:hypothetical protein
VAIAGWQQYRDLSSRRSDALSLQCLDISGCGLVQQILQSAPVVQTDLHLRHRFFRYVNGNATPLRATVQHIMRSLFARAGWEIVFDCAPDSRHVTERGTMDLGEIDSAIDEGGTARSDRWRNVPCF